MTMLDAARAQLERWLSPEWRLERQAAQLLRRAQRTVLDAIAADATEETPDSYRVGSRHTRSLVVDGLPAEVAPGWDGWLASLLRLDGGVGGEVWLSLRVQPLSSAGASLKLTMAESGHAATMHVRASAGLVADRKVQHALRDVDRMQDELADGTGRLFGVTTVVVCVAPSPEGLDALWRQVTATLDQRVVPWRPLCWRHAEGFQQATLSGRWPVSLPRTWNTSTLAYSWPCVGSAVGMPEGPLWGVDVRSGEAVLYDPFARHLGGPPAPHGVLIGQTGAGKTTAWSHLLGEYLTQDDPPHVTQIDPKGEDYTGLAVALGGQIVALSAEPERTLNVMDLPPATEGARPGASHNPVHAAVSTTLGLVALVCAADEAPLGALEKALVQRAALAAYRQRDIRPEAPATWDVTRQDVPTLQELHAHLAAMPEAAAQELAVRLEPYAVGVYAALLARPTTVDQDCPLLVFDLQGLRPELRPLATYLVVGFTWQQARRSRRRRLFGMDEVATLLRHRESAGLVQEVYTLGRHFGLAAWSAAQLVQHYQASPEGESALGSAHTALLLRQRDDAALDDLARVYHLSPRLRDFLAGAEVGEGVLCTHRGNVALRVQATPWILEQLPQPVSVPTRPG